MGQAIEGYETDENNINTPPAKGIRIFRRESDGLYYAKLPDGTLDLIGGGGPDADIVPVKLPVRAASTANVNILAPGAAIDGVVLVNGDRVLLKNQTIPSENGTYIFNGAATPLTRTTDTFQDGYLVVVTEGTVNHDSLWELNTPNPIVIGTTPLTFIAFFPVTAFNPPIARYVYLVQEASDVARMLDGTNNVFNTAQSAYNAANTLALSVPGVVIIEVLNTDSAAVGGITIPLGQDWNPNVQLQGISNQVSNIGTITNLTVGARTSITFSNVFIQSIVQDVAVGAAGNLTLSALDSVIGSISANSAAGTGGIILINAVNLLTSNISSNGTAGGGSITINGQIITTGNLSNNSSVGTGSITLNITNGLIGTITSNGGANSILVTGSSLLLGVISSTGGLNLPGATVNILASTMSGIAISSITSTGNGTGSGGLIRLSGCTYRVASTVSSIGGAAGSAGAITLSQCKYSINGAGVTVNCNIVQTSNAATATVSTLTIQDSNAGTVTQNNNANAYTFGTVTIQSSELSGSYDRNGDQIATNNGGWGTGFITDSIIGGSNFLSFPGGTTINLLGTLTIERCIFNASPNFQHLGVSGSMGTLVFNDNVVLSSTLVRYNLGVTVPPTYTWSRNRFRNGVALTASGGGNTLNTYNLNSSTFEGGLTTTGNSILNINGCEITTIGTTGVSTHTVNAKDCVIGNLDGVNAGNISLCNFGRNLDGTQQLNGISSIQGDGLVINHCVFNSSGNSLDSGGTPHNVTVGAALGGVPLLSFFFTSKDAAITIIPLASAV